GKGAREALVRVPQPEPACQEEARGKRPSTRAALGHRGCGAASVPELIPWLRDLGGGAAPALAPDGTNGLLDAPVTAAGLEV
ncbi:hypothetical protein ADL08_14260, partial [Streptomyces sp. NRRL F-6492]